jgi:sialate O-acetylesterase
MTMHRRWTTRHDDVDGGLLADLPPESRAAARDMVRACVVVMLLAWGKDLCGASLDFDPWYGNGMVLQADRPVVVCGMARPAAMVRIALGSDSVEAMADAAGKWHAVLPAGSAAEATLELRVTSAGEPAQSRTVRRGEVWICGGQSNMVYTAAQHHQNPTPDPGAAPWLVFWDGKTWSRTEDRPHQVPLTPLHFGRGLVAARKVPVALIPAGAGGTSILRWVPGEDCRGDPRAAALLDLVIARQALLAAGTVQDLGRGSWAYPDPDPALGLIDHTKVPRKRSALGPPPRLLPPFAVRGVLWWQGEDDQGMGLAYEPLQRCLIRSWRRQLGDEHLPFLIVQLPTYAEKAGGAGQTPGIHLLREAQRRCLDEPATGLVTTIDLFAPGGIHPENKQAYAARLITLAQALAYGEPVEGQGPHPVELIPQAGAMRVRFRGCDTGLRSSVPAIPGFELAGDDRRFVAATATIVAPDTIELRAPGLAAPRQVRYAFAPNPVTGLYGGDLPAVPFASDITPVGGTSRQ